jgi:hypothetical protein
LTYLFQISKIIYCSLIINAARAISGNKQKREDDDMNEESITEGQKKQFDRFFQDSKDKAWEEISKTGKGNFQRLLERGDKLQNDIINSAKLQCGVLFIKEGIKSTSNYVSGYKAKISLEENLWDINEELKVLRKLFPDELRGG